MFDKKAYMKEYHKKWYQDNKARLADKFKVNHANNRERDARRGKDWYENNKEITKERAKLSYTRDKNRTRNNNFKRNYGISLADYDNMFIAQEGKCAICGVHIDKLKSRLCVDHNHSTGKVRGLLCGQCNFCLGQIKEDINTLVNMIAYLEKHEQH